MADPVTPAVPATPALTADDATTAPPAAPATDEPLGDPGKAALTAERKARREAEAAQTALAAKLKEYEDRDKSDAQKLAEENATLKAENAETKKALLRAEVAEEKKVPANLLTGSTREEIEAAADALLGWKGPQTPPPPIPATPPTDGQGNAGVPVGTADLDTRIAAAQAAGNIRLALSLTNQKIASRKD